MTPSEFSLAYQEGYRKVVLYIYYKKVPLQEAEEISQEAWAKGWQNLATFRGDCTILTWIYTIAFNLFINKLRKDTHYNLVELNSDVLYYNNTYDNDILLKEVLSYCPPEDKLLLVGRYLEGIEYKEFAESGSPITGRINVTRAKDRLRKVLDL